MSDDDLYKVTYRRQPYMMISYMVQKFLRLLWEKDRTY